MSRFILFNTYIYDPIIADTPHSPVSGVDVWWQKIIHLTLDRLMPCVFW